MAASQNLRSSSLTSEFVVVDSVAPASLSVPFKYFVSPSRRRERLSIPLKLAQMHTIIIKSFPDLQHKELNITYVDDENDTITVLSDAELEEAFRIFQSMGRVMSFVVSVRDITPKKSSNISKQLPATTVNQVRRKVVADLVLENGSVGFLQPGNIFASAASCGGGAAHFATATIPALCVARGKWMFETVLQSGGCMQIGWVRPGFSCKPWSGDGVGDDINSWAVDGYRLQKWHKGSCGPYGRLWGTDGFQRWKAGDIIGCVYDADKGEISFFWNGQCLGVAYSVPKHTVLRPGASLSAQQGLRFVLEGKQIHFPVVGAKPIADLLLETVVE